MKHLFVRALLGSPLFLRRSALGAPYCGALVLRPQTVELLLLGQGHKFRETAK